MPTVSELLMGASNVSGVRWYGDGTRKAETVVEVLSPTRVKVTAASLSKGLNINQSVGMRHKRALHRSGASGPAKVLLDELGLDPTVRELAQRHLTKGDVWRFLRDVGLEVQRFEKEATELKERERDTTERFVTQVIEVREEEHRVAWHKYKALMEVLNKAKARKIDLPQLMTDREIGEAVRRSMGQDTAQDSPSQCAVVGGGEGARDAWLYPQGSPGGYVHVPTRRQSVAARAAATPASSSSSSSSFSLASPPTSACEMGRGDSASPVLTAPWPLATVTPLQGSTAHSLAPPTASSASASCVGAGPSPELLLGKASCPTTATATASSLHTPSTTGSGNGVARLSLRGSGGGHLGQQSAVVLPLVLGGVSAEEADMAWREGTVDRSLGRQVQGTTGARMSAADAEFVRGAAAFLTEGLEDSVARLLRVCVCRAFVPSSMDPEVTSGREAYERLCQLPAHALARRRHEEESWAYAQRLTRNMEFEGYRTIGDLVPLRRHALVLQERLGVSSELVGVMADIVRALHTCTPLSKILKPRTWCRYDSMRHARYLFSRLRSNGWWAQRYHTRPPLTPPPTTSPLRLTAAALHHSPLAYQPCLTPLPPCPLLPAPSSSPPVASDGGACPSLSDDDVVTKLLRDEAQWGTLHGPIDRFLLMAAFYILPHPPLAPDPGPSALVAFIATLQAMQHQDDRRRALKLRYQRCLQLSVPYVRRLRAAGVLRVKDLCRVDLPSWRLEPAYAKQVEDMAAKLLAKHLYARATGRTRQQEASFISGAFDPRFQRSATDSYGRPPRLEAIRSKVREDHEGLGLQWASDDVPLPRGLWDHESSQFEEDEKDEEASTESSVEGKGKGGQWRHRKETEKDDKEEEREDKARGVQDEAWFDKLTRRRSTTGALGSISHLSAATKGASDASTRSSNTAASQKGPKEKLKASAGHKPRTFICRHSGCAQPFLHLSTLRAHERTHALFPVYHRWKSQAQIYRDSPFEPHIPEYLPPYRIRNELERLRRQGEDAISGTAV